MKSKRPERMKGYDVLVWIDGDGDVVCSGYTAGGNEFLRTICPQYKTGQVLEIISPPEEFRKHIPPKVKVGLVSPGTKKITSMFHGPLH